MLCYLCQRELETSLTGGLAKHACSVCRIYYVEQAGDSAPTPEDLWNIIRQITRKEPDYDP